MDSNSLSFEGGKNAGNVAVMSAFFPPIAR